MGFWRAFLRGKRGGRGGGGGDRGRGAGCGGAGGRVAVPWVLGETAVPGGWVTPVGIGGVAPQDMQISVADFLRAVLIGVLCVDVWMLCRWCSLCCCICFCIIRYIRS